MLNREMSFDDFVVEWHLFLFYVKCWGTFGLF